MVKDGIRLYFNPPEMNRLLNGLSIPINADIAHFSEAVKVSFFTTVSQSKEDMKQWNGDKMRKWSHTFSTCSKVSHPHSPLTDHGSCCHTAHAVLSFLWFSQKSPSYG